MILLSVQVRSLVPFLGYGPKKQLKPLISLPNLCLILARNKKSRAYDSQVRNSVIEIVTGDARSTSFDEENSTNKNSQKEDDKPKAFFGFEVGDSLIYGVVIFFIIIFIYKTAGVFAVRWFALCFRAISSQ